MALCITLPLTSGLNDSIRTGSCCLSSPVCPLLPGISLPSWPCVLPCVSSPMCSLALRPPLRLILAPPVPSRAALVRFLVHGAPCWPWRVRHAFYPGAEGDRPSGCHTNSQTSAPSTDRPTSPRTHMGANSTATHLRSLETDTDIVPSPHVVSCRFRQLPGTVQDKAATPALQRRPAGRPGPRQGRAAPAAEGPRVALKQPVEGSPRAPQSRRELPLPSTQGTTHSGDIILRDERRTANRTSWVCLMPFT